MSRFKEINFKEMRLKIKYIYETKIVLHLYSAIINYYNISTCVQNSKLERERERGGIF